MVMGRLNLYHNRLHLSLRMPLRCSSCLFDVDENGDDDYDDDDDDLEFYRELMSQWLRSGLHERRL